MGLSAFNAMRARMNVTEAKEEVKTESAVKVTEVKSESVEEKPKKKTDAEKLKKE